MIQKLSKKRSIKLTGTIAGQREELREQRNKINELVEAVNTLMGEEKALDLTNRCPFCKGDSRTCGDRAAFSPSQQKEPTGWEKLPEDKKLDMILVANTPRDWRGERDRIKQFISQLLSQQNERHAMYVAAIESNAEQRLTVYKARVRERISQLSRDRYYEIDDILQEIDKLK